MKGRELALPASLAPIGNFFCAVTSPIGRPQDRQPETQQARGETAPATPRPDDADLEIPRPVCHAERDRGPRGQRISSGTPFEGTYIAILRCNRRASQRRRQMKTISCRTILDESGDILVNCQLPVPPGLILLPASGVLLSEDKICPAQRFDKILRLSRRRDQRICANLPTDKIDQWPRPLRRHRGS